VTGPMPHLCHLERRPAAHGTAARAVCSCGWTGTWYAVGGSAVENGIDHQRAAAAGLVRDSGE
jgi:hypothetical protein